MDAKLGKAIKAMAEGGEFDVAEGVRLVAQGLVAAGLVIEEEEEQRPPASTPGTPGKGKK